jgi:Spy/CpxP family protein refolding chaperone
MSSRSLRLALAGCLVAGPASAANPPPSPYAGQQTRPIKALSAEEIAAPRNGEGMGMAKAAELNGYPGPVHVLGLANQLRLSESQRAQIAAIHARMSAAAKPLGEELITREQTLDQLFATGEITPERLSAETTAIGELQGRLRSVHLAAHLETRALLSPDQIATYRELRGYANPPAPMEHHHSGSSH